MGNFQRADLTMLTILAYICAIFIKKITMKNKLITFLLLFMAVSFFSCEKFSDDEVFNDKDANSMLVIRTRVAQVEGAEGTAKISYPVNVYIFDESGSCVYLEQIVSEEENLSLNLPEGSYDVYALAGTDAEAYELPTKENAVKDAVVALKDGHGHGDVMTAHNSVTLAYGEENTLTLSLERKVMMLESVTISNVPASVTAVAVSVSPLYENIKLDGSYSGEKGEYIADLVREGESNVWKSSGAVYLLEAAGAATVKVAFTANDKMHSYSYLCPQELKANYKVNISGTYRGDGVELNGSITGVEWAGTTNVTFEFDETGESETVVPGGDGDDEPSGGDVVTGTVPEVGSLYKGCYVLMTDEVEKTATLMSPKCLTNLVFTEGDQESLKAAVDEGIAGLAVAGVTGWRLANVEEMDYMRANYTTIMNNIASLKDAGEDVDAFMDYAVLYYFLNGEGFIKSGNLRNTVENDPVSNSSSDILRAFTTVSFTE